MKRLFYLVYAILLIILFLSEFFHPITAINVDLGRHLLLGKIIATTHQVPRTNLLSYTYPDFPYINTSWLTEVFYYYIFSFGGFNLLLVENTLFIALALGLLVFHAIKKNGLTFATLLSATFYLLLLGLRSDIRPEVMSMVCLALFMLILYKVRESNNKKLFFFLILIELLWVNLHIYFFVGLILIVLFLLDDVIAHRFSFANTKVYGVCLLGTLIAMAINPNGVTGAAFPLLVLRNYGLPVVENQSLLTLFTLYHASEILLPLIAIVLLFTILFMTRKQTKPIDWLLAVAFSFAAFIVFRNILLFVFATFLLFTNQLNLLSKKQHFSPQKIPNLLSFFIFTLLFLFLLLFIMRNITNNGFGFGVNAYEENAVNFLVSNKIQGPIYNNFDSGDYLSYRLYPQRVFVENRPEAYPTSFFQQIYLPMQNNPEIFNKLDKKYHFNAVAISYWDNTPWGTKLLQYLVNTSHFKIVYLDTSTVILIADTATNRIVIAHHDSIERKLPATTHNQEELIHYLFFFEKVGWIKQLDSTLTLIRETDPKLCSLRKYPLEHSSIEKYIIKNNLANGCSKKVLYW